MKIISRLILAAFICLGASAAQASCWQWSKTANNNATADASINWQEGMSPSSVNDSARAMMARLAECRDDLSGFLLTTGTATAYAVTTNQGLNATPNDGQSIAVRLNTTNGTAATLAADGGNVYPIQTAPGSAVGSGVLIAGTPYRLTFNLSSAAWVLQGFYTVSIAPGSIQTSMIANSAVTYALMQNVTAARLLGNPTGGAAPPSEILLGTGLSFSGQTLNATDNPALFPGFLSGLITSTAGSSATFGVAAGAANDMASGGIMVLASAYTKTTSAWAVGTGNGSLDVGSIANSTWYAVFEIERPDTGVVDICITLTTNTSCLFTGSIPSAYSLQRRIAYMKTTAGGQWTAFTQVYDKFIWAAQVSDLGGGAMAASRTNVPLTVPPAIVNALFRVVTNNSGANAQSCMFPSLIETDIAVTALNADLSSFGTPAGASFERLTDALGRIAYRCANNNGQVYINTYGWIDSRGK